MGVLELRYLLLEQELNSERMVDDSLHSHESNVMNNFLTNMTPRSKFTSDYLILLRVNFGLRFIPFLILNKFLYISTAQQVKVVII